MLTSLFKKSSNAGSAQYFTTVAFGAIGVTIVLLQDFPKSFVWSLSPLCECTFLVGVAQVSKAYYWLVTIICNCLDFILL